WGTSTRTVDAWVDEAERLISPTGIEVEDTGGCGEDVGSPRSPRISAPLVTGDGGCRLRVPLLYSGRVRTSRPDAAPPRTAAAGARPPTGPGHCPGPRSPRGSIGICSCQC